MSDVRMRGRSTAFRDVLPYLAWTQALVATSGSLFLSEVLGYPPCTLCWYQRIAMYPLVIVLAVGILRQDRDIHLYVIPLSVIGLAIAVYHNLLYVGIIPEAASACRAGVSCTTRSAWLRHRHQSTWLGFGWDCIRFHGFEATDGRFGVQSDRILDAIALAVLTGIGPQTGNLTVHASDNRVSHRNRTGRLRTITIGTQVVGHLLALGDNRSDGFLDGLGCLEFAHVAQHHRSR